MNQITFLSRAATMMTAMKFDAPEEQTSMDLHDGMLVCRGLLQLSRDRVFAEVGHLVALSPDTLASIRSSLVRLLLGIAATGKVNNPDNTSPSAPASDHALEILESLLRPPMSKDWKSAFTTAVELLVSSHFSLHPNILIFPRASATRNLGICSASHRCGDRATRIRRRQSLCGHSVAADQPGIHLILDDHKGRSY